MQHINEMEAALMILTDTFVSYSIKGNFNKGVRNLGVQKPTVSKDKAT